jgi:hypothetical protein
MHVRIHVNNGYFCSIVIKLEYFRQVLEKFSKIKRNENQFIRSGTVEAECPDVE